MPVWTLGTMGGDEYSSHGFPLRWSRIRCKLSQGGMSMKISTYLGEFIVLAVLCLLVGAGVYARFIA